MKPYDELTFTDDFMFSHVLQDESLCKELIEILLDIKVEKIEYLASQSTFNEDYLGRGVRFDVYLKDSSRIFDVEMQSSNKGDLPLRARYYQAMMDIDTLKKGEKYTELKESYILFICTFDPFNLDLHKYTLKNVCLESINNTNISHLTDDKTTKVFYNVNGFRKIKDTKVQSLLKYLATQEANSDFTKRLESAVFSAKGNDPWRVNYMTLAMKLDESKTEGIVIGEKMGLQQGLQQKARETAKLALESNLPIDIIQKITGLAIDEINALKQKQ